MEGELQDGLVLKMIAHGVVAGGLRLWARKEPDAASGLMKAAALHSERAGALMDQITRGVGAPR